MKNAWDIFRNINDWLRFSDAKAGVILGFAGASAAFLGSKTEHLHELLTVQGGSCIGLLGFGLVIGYMLALVATIVLAFASIWPSLGGGGARSKVFFQHISEDYGSNTQQYAEDVGKLSEEQWNFEMAHQICANSKIASRKYKLIDRSIRALALTGAFWIATLAFLVLTR